MAITVLLFWIYLFIFTLVFVLQWCPPFGNCSRVVISISIDFSFKLKMDAPFHRTDYGYSWADWYCQFSWSLTDGTNYSKILFKSLKKLKGYCCLSKPYPSKFFKGCLPQILLGPSLNTLSKMFHGRIPLNSTLLLRVLNFASGSRLEFMYMSGQTSFISMVVSCLWCSHSS